MKKHQLIDYLRIILQIEAEKMTLLEEIRIYLRVAESLCKPTLDYKPGKAMDFNLDESTMDIQTKIDESRWQYGLANGCEGSRLELEAMLLRHISIMGLSPNAKLLCELSDELKKLYDLDIIYPTYRNLIAEAQILEYLESGVCERLEGADGAYAQYMLDVRTTRIIESIENFRDAMRKGGNQITSNQPTAYNLIRESDSHLQYIENSVGKISAQLDGIHNTLDNMHNAQLTVGRYLSDTIVQFSHIVASYDHIAIENAVSLTNQRVQKLKDSISQYRIKYPA